MEYLSLWVAMIYMADSSESGAAPSTGRLSVLIFIRVPEKAGPYAQFLSRLLDSRSTLVDVALHRGNK